MSLYMLKCNDHFFSVRWPDLWSILQLLLNNWKAQSKNDPLIFQPFLKVFRSSWILACGLSFTRYTLFWFFFRWFALRFREITYAKNLEFRSGFHWMKPKQKRMTIFFANCQFYNFMFCFKGTLSQASLQKCKSAKTHFTATETYKYWSSFDKSNNASKKSFIVVIKPGTQDTNLKKSAWFFQVLPPWQCHFKLQTVLY